MRMLVFAAALACTALGVIQEAEAQRRGGASPFGRCVPTPTASGRTVLVCGSPAMQRGVYNPVTCRKVYNAYTRRFETVC